MQNWETIDGQLTKQFNFKDFVSAVHFVDAIAEVAEAHNHHPDILIHSYKKVKVSLFTHSAQAITPKDYELADAIDSLTS
ncbi:MAG TPA: 4a-hydroxytetrahydrobiopterin dehydratase [Bacteroidales bacterium]